MSYGFYFTWSSHGRHGATISNAFGARRRCYINDSEGVSGVLTVRAQDATTAYTVTHTYKCTYIHAHVHIVICRYAHVNALRVCVHVYYRYQYIHPSTQYRFTIFPFPRIQPGKFSSDSFYCEYSESVIYLRFVIEHCGALRTLAVIPSSELDSLVWLISSSILAQLYSYIQVLVYVCHEYQ